VAAPAAPPAGPEPLRGLPVVALASAGLVPWLVLRSHWLGSKLAVGIALAFFGAHTVLPELEALAAPAAPRRRRDEPRRWPVLRARCARSGAAPEPPHAWRMGERAALGARRLSARGWGRARALVLLEGAELPGADWLGAGGPIGALERTRMSTTEITSVWHEHAAAAPQRLELAPQREFIGRYEPVVELPAAHHAIVSSAGPVTESLAQLAAQGVLPE
jgi:hypothetical protein